MSRRQLARTGALLTCGALASGAFAWSCKTSAASEEQDGTPVAFLLATLQEERYLKDQRYFEVEARKNGLRPFTWSADNDSSRQLSQVQDALARGAKILVIQATDRSAAASYVTRAHESGAKVVAYDRAIVGADAWVAHDNYLVGKLQAEEALKATGGEGNYVLLNGQSGHSAAEEIARGYRETLASAVKAGRVRIAVDKNHEAWSPEEALKTVEDALTKTQGQVHAVLANNSGLARGAVQAVRAKGLSSKGIFIAGADADAANVNYLCEGKQSLEVFKDIRGLAEMAAQVTAKLARGEAVRSQGSRAGVPDLGAPVQLVRKESVQAVLVESGFHTRTRLNSCTTEFEKLGSPAEFGAR